MSHALSKGCLTGEIGDCLCDDKVQEQETINGTEEWRWKGCLQKTGYAKNIVREFLGSRRVFPINISLMRTHNEEFGIQVHNSFFTCKTSTLQRLLALAIFKGDRATILLFSCLEVWSIPDATVTGSWDYALIALAGNYSRPQSTSLGRYSGNCTR